MQNLLHRSARSAIATPTRLTSRRSTAISRGGRRWASTDSSGTEGTHHAPKEAKKEEHLGRTFYILLSTLPLAVILSNYLPSSSPTQSSPFASLTAYLNGLRESSTRQFTERNELHTRAIERAAFERNLDLNCEVKGGRGVELKFPEIFNTGSPYNVAAGQGGGNLDQVLEHYRRLNREAEERKLRVIEGRGEE
ncbi:MAG: hypothetical protein M1817_002423 [Caeruleum heppii]|nr:MAG: hypothetical protein M1817_002423 [Caeruleum heppii]